MVCVFKNWKLLLKNIYENTCGWKGALKYVKCCLKTENGCLKIQTKHPLRYWDHCGPVWYTHLNTYFQFLNNITHIFTHFFNYTYFHICFQFLSACTKHPLNTLYSCTCNSVWDSLILLKLKTFCWKYCK